MKSGGSTGTLTLPLPQDQVLLSASILLRPENGLFRRAEGSKYLLRRFCQKKALTLIRVLHESRDSRNYLQIFGRHLGWRQDQKEQMGGFAVKGGKVDPPDASPKDNLDLCHGIRFDMGQCEAVTETRARQFFSFHEAGKDILPAIRWDLTLVDKNLSQFFEDAPFVGRLKVGYDLLPVQIIRDSHIYKIFLRSSSFSLRVMAMILSLGKMAVSPLSKTASSWRMAAIKIVSGGRLRSLTF